MMIKKEAKKPALFSLISCVFLFCIMVFFDKGLAVGLLLFVLLIVATILVMRKADMQDPGLYNIFFIAIIIHAGVTLFIHYFNFNPFGGGADFTSYHGTAVELASRFSHGNFSLQGLYTEHFFPILIGILYMFTVPSMVVGQLFVVWLAAVSVAMAYIIVLEMGGTKKTAFLAGLITTFYPSYLFFGSVLLKDTMVVPFVLLGIWLILKMVKRFYWLEFLVFFSVLTALINLRFYVGYALMFALIISWPLLSAFSAKKKMVYWVAMILLLGFAPEIVGNGYYASDSFAKFLNPKQITYFREVVYANPPSKPSIPGPVMPKPSVSNPPGEPKPGAPEPVKPHSAAPKPSVPQPSTSAPEINNGNGSTFVLNTGFHDGVIVFAMNYGQSFIYSLLGPFPWQFTQKRQIVGLVETIPWYLLILFFAYGSVLFIRKRGIVEFLNRHKYALPLSVFSVMALGALSLFINNYGIIARIRIPMFICLISIMCLSLDDKENDEKISHYWRQWVYRIPFVKRAFKAGR